MQTSWLWLKLLVGLALLAPAGSFAQQAPDPLNSPLSAPPPAPTQQEKRLYRDLDLLRRGGFAAAERATVSLSILDQSGSTPAGLQLSDFELVVNGTRRKARLHVPGTAAPGPSPMVLLVLPPNQPTVHYLAIKHATQYFAAQPAELLPWNVGILDSNGKLTNYTNGRTQLLANLDMVAHAPEPFQFSNDIGMQMRFRWESNWLTKAQDAVGMMQRFAGPKVVLAINPLAQDNYGLNDQMFAHDGPEALVSVAQQVGAHIYVGNVGGPEVYVPGGDAAESKPAQRVGANRQLLLGSTPSYHQQGDPEMVRALNGFAYNTSQMMMAAEATMGGFSNSLSELAGKIHRDLDGNYSLEFDMTAEDTDKGVPVVGVKLARKEMKLAVLDVEPVVSESDAEAETASRELLATLRKTAAAPVSSPEFRITQHVDYFPMHGGLEPVLPMSGAVEWTGSGRPPRQLSVLEEVEDPNLSNVILERSVQAQWNGQAFSWERDGVLRPGDYVWRVAVVNGARQVLASAEEKIAVGMPRHEQVAASSLVVGKSCRAVNPPSGLQARPRAGEKPLAAIDPMHAADCRVKPEATDTFTGNDVLHAFVRIYPQEKLEKHKPESWTAHFALRAPGGAVEAASDVPFTVDSGSGYLAAIALPMGGATIRPGPHIFDVAIHGPGVKGELTKSREIDVTAAVGLHDAAAAAASQQR